MTRRSRVLTSPPCAAPLFARVVAATRALSGVEAVERYDGATVLRHDGRFRAGAAMHSSAEPDSLVVKVSLDDRDTWIEEAPAVYYVTDFYRPHPVVLIRLRRLDDDTLAAVLLNAWRVTGDLARDPR